MDLESEKPYQFAKSGCSCWVDCTQHSKSVLRCLFRQIHVILGLRSDGRQVHPGVKGTGSSWYSNVFPPLLGKHPAHPGGNMLSPFIEFLVTLQLCTRTPADRGQERGEGFPQPFWLHLSQIPTSESSTSPCFAPVQQPSVAAPVSPPGVPTQRCEAHRACAEVSKASGHF